MPGPANENAQVTVIEYQYDEAGELAAFLGSDGKWRLFEIVDDDQGADGKLKRGPYTAARHANARGKAQRILAAERARNP